MQHHLLFVDTETSGIPPSLNAPINDLDNWPFVLQLAWRVYDNTGLLIKTENHFIFEEDIYIEESSIKIHGITRDELLEKGENRKTILRLFANDLRKFKPLVIGHFVEFDSKMLQVALFRSGLKNILRDLPHFCTMRATSEYTQFPNHDYPKLEELHASLFGERMERTHNAEIDAKATARCFFELYQRGDLNDKLIYSQPLFTKVKSEMSQKPGCGLPVLFLLTLAIFIYFI